MAEVGVLNLTIHDNSETAAGGLDKLAKKLSAVKDAATGFNLSPVAGAVKAVQDAVEDNETIKQLANLFGALSSFGKLKSFSIDTKQFSELRKSLDGMTIGNTGTQLKNIREALGGDWATENLNDVMSTMNAVQSAAAGWQAVGVAKTFNEVAKAINNYNRSIKDMPEGGPLQSVIAVLHTDVSTIEKETQKVGTEFGSLLRDVVAGHRDVGENAVAGFNQGIDSRISEAANTAGKIGDASVDELKKRLDEHSPSKVMEQIGEYAGEGFIKGLQAKQAEAQRAAIELAQAVMSGAKDSTGIGGAFVNVDETVQRTTKSLETVRSANGQIADGVAKIKDATGQIDYSKININDYIASPLEHVRSQLAGVGNEIDSFKDKINASIPAFKNYRDAVEGLGSKKDIAEFSKKAIELPGAANMSETVAQTKTVVAETEKYAAVCEKINSEVQATTQSIEDQLRTRRELMEAENQRRLESNYEQYRELYLSKEGNWQNQVPEMYGFTPKALEEGETYAEALKITMREVDEYVERFISLGNSPAGNLLSDTIDQAFNAKLAMKDAKDSASVLRNAPEISEGIKNVQQASEGMRSSLNNSRTATRVLTDDMKNLDKELKSKKTDMQGVSEEASRLQFSFKDLKKGIQSMFPTMTGLLKQFTRMAKMRAIRALIRQIAAGFKEGVQNVYEYSKAAGTSFAPAMDEAASALATMKNSIGAMAAPMIQSLIPVLQQLVSWFINLINYVNQFLALIRGQSTWTRALPQTVSAFGKQEKAAKGAASAMKDLLADWDELNIIQSETGGGTGASGNTAAEDYLNMFEEVAEYDSKIKQMVNFVKDNLNEIENVATGIGLAILGWKLSKAFAESLPFLATLGKGLVLGATVGLTISLTDLTGKQYAKTGEPGWLIADALSGAVGSTLAYKIASKMGGSSFGFITSGFTLMITGAVNILNAKSAMENYNEGAAWALGGLGSLEAGIGAGLATYGFGGTLAGSIAVGGWTAALSLVITAVMLIEAKNKATNKKMAYLAFAKTGENGISPDDYLKELQSRFSELTKGATLVVDAMIGFDESGENFRKSIVSLQSLNAFITSGQSLTEAQATEFKKAWEIVFTELDRMGSMSYETIFTGLEEAIKNGSERISTAALELKQKAVEVAGLTGGARGQAQEEMKQIMDEIGAGNYERAGRYIELYNIWGGEETQESVNKYIDGIMNQTIALSKEKPVEDAKNFLDRLQSEFATPALDLVKQQYDSEMKAIEEQKDELEKAFLSRYITKEQKEASLEELDNIASLFKMRWDEQVAQIQNAVGSGYKSIAEQVVGGFYDYTLTPGQRQSYMEEVIQPIIKMFEEANRELPDELKRVLEDYDMFGPGLFEDSVSEAKFRSKYGRRNTYGHKLSMYMQEQQQYGISNVSDIPVADLGNLFVTMLANELGTEEGLMALTADDKKDIVNSLLQVLPEEVAAYAIRFLTSEESGYKLNGDLVFGLEDILGWIDWSKLEARNGEKYETSVGEYEYSLENLMDELSGIIEEYNYKNNKTLSLPGIDSGGVETEASKAAEVYEDMASRIRNAFLSLSGLGFDFEFNGFGGNIKVNFATDTSATTTGSAAGVPTLGGAYSFVNGGGFSGEEQVDQTRAVENGTKAANSELEDNTRTTNDLLRLLIAKTGQTTISPSSLLGLINKKSNERAEMVTGG